MMKAFRVRWWVAGAILAVGGGGCAEKDTEGVSRLSPRTVPYLEGVPVPDGFTMVNRASTDYESGGQRNAMHTYQGWGGAAEVREFYQDQMPATGWARVSAQSVEGVITLRFEKQNEACTVEIRPAGLVNLNQTRINVTVSPFTRAKAPEPPRRQVP